MRMRAPVRPHELRLLARKEMAYLEDALDMPGRNRYAIIWIRNLGDEAAILAHCLGKTQSRSGRAILQHLLQNTLIVGDGGRICDGA